MNVQMLRSIETCRAASMFRGKFIMRNLEISGRFGNFHKLMQIYPRLRYIYVYANVLRCEALCLTTYHRRLLSRLSLLETMQMIPYVPPYGSGSAASGSYGSVSNTGSGSGSGGPWALAQVNNYQMRPQAPVGGCASSLLAGVAYHEAAMNVIR